MILIIDNFDSFTYNLYQYVSEFADAKVYRCNEITIDEIKKLNPSGIIISPGPGRPEEATLSIEIIKKLGESIPILGICLGHECIAAAYGTKVVRANEIFHGKTSTIQLKGKGIFNCIPRKIEAMRYHSLIVDNSSLSDSLEIIASVYNTGEIMGIKHKKYDVYGLQFHPESIYTPKGKNIIANFVVNICNDSR
ncbi:aminodeoxychorismate/anthranilate synthase component II [Clostridium sp. BJN0001]|uniref:anthranilate synthase component II n=1 Tax=Clostridium sp. BJN0001 TaxID=2930219 RepID=UPI001FD298A0|nr:aminodeoxychorismate/anthranilate synthase component II [Clostridium sp. BJN0001]